MKSTLPLIILGITTLSLSAVTTYQFDGLVTTDTGASALDGMVVSGSFSYDETAIPNQGLLNAEAVDFEVSIFGQTFTQMSESNYLGESSPFYAIYFDAGVPVSISFAVAENQTALDAVTGKNAMDFPLENAFQISDTNIQAFGIEAGAGVAGTSITLVPEPSAALLSLLGLGFLARRKRA